MLYLYLGVFLAAAIAATFLTWTVRNKAIANGWVAKPASARHLHQTGIPRLGGVAILLTVLAVAGGAVAVSRFFHLEPRLPVRTLVVILAAGMVSFLAGLRDDLAGIPPWT